MLGVIQEQHAERCQLFAQWKGFDWPILHDPLNRLGLRAVPVTIAIDEHGIVRDTRPNPKSFRSKFADVEFARPSRLAPKASKPQIAVLRKAAEAAEDANAYVELGDALLLWEADRESQAIKAYQKAIALDSRNSSAHFRLGVALRRRSESTRREPNDFAAAVDSWNTALAGDPNQYIYRRRIQQYGPRLDKPYPFYDWVVQAREEITARGDKAVTLPVSPSGAEIAAPSRNLDTPEERAENPDPNGAITRDTAWVDVRSVVVRSTGRSREAARVHLEFALREQSHWNNEAEPLVVWIESPDGAQLGRNLLKYASPNGPESRENRRVEFEIRVPEETSVKTIRGFALYNICEEANGQCLYRRRDFVIPLQSR